MKKKKSLFRQMDDVEYISDNGFLFQWCCDCHLRHIWHFEIMDDVRDKTGARAIKICGIDDRVATEMRRKKFKKK